jgi:hypothetical protein
MSDSARVAPAPSVAAVEQPTEEPKQELEVLSPEEAEALVTSDDPEHVRICRVMTTNGADGFLSRPT